LEAALALLRAEVEVRVVTCSELYETTPWPEIGSPREAWHLNCAVEIETDLPPRRLLRLTQAIETQSGRVATASAAGAASQRSLDIDILLYADEVIAEDRLQIPHPFLHLRRFVLIPLADIAPQVEHPTLYQSIAELLGELPGEGDVLPYRG
jgi:2-amino-4-hydroxy-6-hydroxymethyldihydropteridine diphosphokinase